jgi:hypothetical protein
MKNQNVGLGAWAFVLLWALVSSLEFNEQAQASPENLLPNDSRLIDSAIFQVIPFGSNKMPKPVTLTKVVEPSKHSSSNVYELRNLSVEQLRAYLERIGFRDLNGMQLNHLRQLYASWAYGHLLSEVSERTSIPVSTIFSFFIFEATSQGIETDLFRLHWNPGGVKFYGHGESIDWRDDCGSIPCAFRSTEGFNAAVQLWSSTLNSSRYSDCKDGTPEQICRSLIMAGYSTDKSWEGRASLCSKYELYRKKFPKKSSKILTS